MEPEDLPEPDDLWWSWVVLAALHAATGDGTCGFDAETRVLHLDAADGSWLRMQRTLGNRATLWGRSSLAPPAPPDARHGAPDWALTEATDDRRPSFLAWHAHGEWDTSSPCDDEGAIHLLRPILTVDPRAVEAVRRGPADRDTLSPWTIGEHLDAAVELVRLAAADTPRVPPGGVRARLREQIHDQMREAPERDRMLIQRPPSIVQWSRVNGPGIPFSYAVMGVRQQLVASPANPHLPEPAVHTLTNVLNTLHREEATEDSGAWLFAQVWSDGVVVSFDRAFDSWPPWYVVYHASEGPTLEDLAWEMGQRAPRWRPAWASLLPR